jgi:hypothetical protein
MSAQLVTAYKAKIGRTNGSDITFCLHHDAGGSILEVSTASKEVVVLGRLTQRCLNHLFLNRIDNSDLDVHVLSAKAHVSDRICGSLRRSSDLWVFHDEHSSRA